MDKIILGFWIGVFTIGAIYCGIKGAWGSFIICCVMVIVWAPLIYHKILK